MYFRALGGLTRHGRVLVSDNRRGNLGAAVNKDPQGSLRPQRPQRQNDKLDVALRGAAILMVDDHPANLVALEATLAPLGHRMVSANSGEEALKALLAEEFAVILLDVQMPHLDGFETATLIRAHPCTAQTPIIFITAIHRAPHLPGLRARRGRLPVQTLRAKHPARQGRGLRRPVPAREAPGSPGRGAARTRARGTAPARRAAGAAAGRLDAAGAVGAARRWHRLLL